jgi:CheY-like chemotaxis protein
METVKNLLEGIAAVLWPIIVVCVLLIFRPAVAAIIESAKSRKFTLKVGGQELTMEEASEQQRTIISDLQRQIIEIRKIVSHGGPIESAKTQKVSTQDRRPIRSILWVDDNPRNNSYFVQQLKDWGISVDLALDTSEGIARFRRGLYDCVVSDMGRREGGSYHAEAGLELLREVRRADAQIPFIIFCSSRGVIERGQEAHAAGATGITSSPSDLYGLLRINYGESVAS